MHVQFKAKEKGEQAKLFTQLPHLLECFTKHPLEKHPKLAAFGLILLLLNLAFGQARLAYMDKKLDEADVFTGIALQGNVPSSAKWSLSNKETAERYLILAKEAVNAADKNAFGGERIIVMPETAFPFTLRDNSKYAKALSEFTANNGVYLAAGAFSDEAEGSGNGVFMFSPDGKMSKPYLKQKLVPFGEFLPYRSFFETFVPVLAEINILSEDVVAGSEASVFETASGGVGAIICYESIFPEICRKSVNDGADIIIVSTNDSWFGSSGALRHHLAASSLRAIENFVPVIRSANTGISALIRPDGKVVEMLGANKTGFVCSELPKGIGETLYSKVGDVWLYACMLYVVGCLILKRDDKYRKCRACSKST